MPLIFLQPVGEKPLPVLVFLTSLDHREPFLRPFNQAGFSVGQVNSLVRRGQPLEALRVLSRSSR